MLSIFFGLSWAYDIILAIAILALLFVFVKFHVARIFIITAITIAFVAYTAWSLTQLQAYYQASGGIYGALTGLFKPNQVQVIDELKFDFKNIMLTATDTQNEYEAEIMSDKVIQLSADDFYMVYVNGTPCTYVNNATDYILAQYEYNFYDSNMEVLCNDTLTFRFAFYTNSSKLTVTTNGGSSALHYWQEYFNYNTFIVEVSKANFDTTSDCIYEGYHKVTYMAEKIVNEYDENDNVIDSHTYTVVYSKQMIKDGTVSTAPYVGDDEVAYYSALGESEDENSSSLNNGVWTFNGWTIDKVNIINPAEYIPQEDTVFWAVYQYGPAGGGGTSGGTVILVPVEP